MEKSEKVTLLATIVIAGFAFAVIFHYALGNYMHLKYPFNTFLFNPADSFSDFLSMVAFTKDFAPYKGINAQIIYFPLAYILIFPFTLIQNQLIAFLSFASIFWTYWIYMNISKFKCENLNIMQNFQNIFILIFLSYPYLIIMDRGNFDLILFILMSVFVFLFKSEKYLKSALVLAIVNAIKPFYLIFLPLFLFQKKYKEFFLSLVLSSFLIIGGFMLLHGNFWNQITVFIYNLALYNKRFAFDINSGISNCSSLFMALKYILFSLIKLSSVYIVNFIKIYNILNI